MDVSKEHRPQLRSVLSSNTTETIPDATSWFFHSLTFPLDDPLAVITSGSTTLTWSKASAIAWKAFHKNDNDALLHAESAALVGVQELFKADVKTMRITPLYWTPTSDSGIMVKGLWFERSTMLPVDASPMVVGLDEQSIEEGLEEAYRQLRPWATVWAFELQSVIDSDDESAVARCCWTLDENKWVLFIDANEGWIVPSGSKLISSLKARKPSGIRVRRGFDWKRWQKLHKSNLIDRPPKKKFTDLVFVLHGIGQKLSERVESFHFTHAINQFRRSINVELQDEVVKEHLRPDANLQILPINWRSTISFEGGRPPSSTRPEINTTVASGETKEPVLAEENTETANYFSLSDITPPSIPAVRNLIGDVMLDIPYYLSHHKKKIISAVIRETNRIWRLWCTNHSYFADEGRVHILGHSLGSAIALDILSTQSTQVSAEFAEGLSQQAFEFNTTHLVCCGSPAGFFLLLNRANLVPRLSRRKEEGGNNPLIAHESAYGCLAVDNLFNIMDMCDPIAYRMNPAVDVDYSNSLKTAFLPSTSVPFYQNFPVPFRLPSIFGSDFNGRPNQLPKNIELETHNWTREEIAENRFALLNDYGQVDFYIKPISGIVENQYLNMLTAHMNYWSSKEFARFIAVEIGRQPGRQSALDVMKAEKANRSNEVKKALITVQN